jgi:hypothetical protein
MLKMFLPNPFPKMHLNILDKIWQRYPSHVVGKGKHTLRGSIPFPLISKRGMLQAEEEM